MRYADLYERRLAEREPRRWRLLALHEIADQPQERAIGARWTEQR